MSEEFTNQVMRDQLEAEFRIEPNCHKAQILWDYAYREAHDGGFSCIRNIYTDLAELINTTCEHSY